MLRAWILIIALLAPGVLAAAPAKVLRDLAYGPEARQILDVYLPEAPQAAPILVMMHGGGWKLGDKRGPRVWINKQIHWGGRGYIVVSVNTRMLPEADPGVQAADLARALTYVQGQAAGWGGDAGQIVLMGHSSGAHLALLLSADPARYDLPPWRATVALDTAVTDAEALMTGWPSPIHWQAFGEDPEFWQAVSPQAHLSVRGVPSLLVCSELRRISCVMAQRYALAAAQAGAQARVLPVALNHSQINGELGKPGPYTDAVEAYLRGQGLP